MTTQNENGKRTLWQGSWPCPEGVANIIFDTDIGPDFDDVGALVMVHQYENEGRARLLATVCSTSTPYGAPCLRAINTYYGRPDVPVGTLKSRDDIYPTSRGVGYNRRITAEYETDIPDGRCAPDALKVYRQVLAAQPDASVTVIVIGMQTNLYDLLRSGSDESSPLDGMELVRKKVRLISCMAGCYPYSPSPEFNVEGDIEAARFVADFCPVPIMFSSFQIGAQIRTGARTEETEVDNPMRIGYHPGQQSWDQTSVIYAVEGLGEFWTMDRGDLLIDEKGVTTLLPNETSGARAFLVKTSDEANEILRNKIEAAMIAPKKKHISTKAVRYLPGTDEAVNRTGTAVSVEFEGCELYVYGSIGVNGGHLIVTLDGREVGRVSTVLERDIPSCLVFSKTDMAPGKHTLTLCALEEGGRVDVDFFKFVRSLSTKAERFCYPKLSRIFC